MKKLIFTILISLIVLVACSGERNSLKQFTKAYNKNAEKYNVVELNADNFGEIQSENGVEWSVLYEADDYKTEALL